MTAFVRFLCAEAASRRRRALAGLLLACGPASAGHHDHNVQLHGFVAQGAVKTSDNRFYGDSDEGISVAFHEIGLNASWRPLPRLQLAGQLLSRRAGDSDEGDPRIDYALLDWNAVASADQQAGIRLGKIKNPLGLYNDTRDVPFTRPSVILPQSIYFDRTREIGLSAVGGQLYGDFNFAGGLLSAQFNAGHVDETDLDSRLLGIFTPGEFASNVSYIGRLLYDNQRGLVLAVTHAVVDLDYEPGAGSPFGAGSLKFKPTILSVRYDAGDWELTSELAHRPIKLHGFGLFPDTSTTGHSAYLQGIYRFDEKWQGLLRYDVLYSDHRDKNGSAYATATGNPAHTRFAKDWTVGVRWQPDPQWMLSIEYHHVDGTAWLDVLENPGAAEQRWHMLLAELSYRF